jgi:Cu2+-exporting ATPase
VTSGITSTLCLHCGQPSASGEFCCAGCEQVYALVKAAGLDRYYDLRGAIGQPVVRATRRDRAWVEPLREKLSRETAASRLDLDVQGLQCTACVWLIERIFERERGGVEVVVNPTLGRASIVCEPAFDLEHFVESVEDFGYVLGPPRRSEKSRARGLLGRLGVSAAAAMQAMILSVAIYAGLADPALRGLFDAIDFGLATLVVLAGGSVFFHAAIEGLRRRILHLDLPIALGIAASYAGSVWAWRHHGAPYFDTVCVFVTLMLLGRFLQERLIEKNRRLLLDGDDASALLTRRSTGELVPVTAIGVGDRLLVAPGDLVPVDARLESPCACSLDWINGESRPRTFDKAALVPAGAFSCGANAVVAVAETDFDESPLLELLRTPLKGDRTRAVPFWAAVTRRYVIAVLGLAALAFVIWLAATHDGNRALAVTTAVLVVTCPCAFGIATPLAYDLAHARLRQAGLFVRTADFLDRAPDVTRVVFDKTGTLTSGVLRLVELPEMDDEAKVALATLVHGSGHPKAMSIKAALTASPAPVDVHERAGEGLFCRLHGARWRLGRGDFLTKNGVVMAHFDFAEDVRPDAKKEIQELEGHGYEVWIASGDARSRVSEMAVRCGVDPRHALSDMSPWDKAAWLEKHDQGTLFVGDGVNDLVAAEKAFCSGTPAIDRPFVAARSDFYFVTPGLRPVRLALDLAKHLRKVVNRNLRVALGYNALAVGLAFAGVMSPLVCAVLMPVSSLTTIAVTALGLRRNRWT